MKKSKIPPCQNHSLSPTVEKGATLTLRLALRAFQPLSSGCVHSTGGTRSRASALFRRLDSAKRKAQRMQQVTFPYAAPPLPFAGTVWYISNVTRQNRMTVVL